MLLRWSKDNIDDSTSVSLFRAIGEIRDSDL
jgi:hypothetical protein